MPVLSLLATLALLGVAFTLLHWLILWLNLPDLVALLLFAIPVVAYLAWCTVEERAAQLRFALQMYLGFSAVTIASAAIVYLID